MLIDITRETPISSHPRVKMLEAMFDVPAEEKSTVRWCEEVDMPTMEEFWRCGLIVGPSGSGKSTIGTTLLPQIYPIDTNVVSWNDDAVIANFDPKLSIESITGACSSVGFNTIPAWMRPYDVLSTGEKFRVDLARTLAEAERDSVVVIDEFTSVVDRNVAKIGSHAVQKYVRKEIFEKNVRVVAISCHYDIIEWLQPDWILHMPTLELERRLLQREFVPGRPDLHVSVSRVPYSAWRTFSPFHYLTAELNNAAKCFCLFVHDDAGNAIPAAFAATIHRPHAHADDIEGLSRIVTLPDWQGLGLAFILSDLLGAAFKGIGKRFHTYPAHPALIRGYDRSPNYAMRKRPGQYSPRKGTSSTVAGKFGGRPGAVFSYEGSALERAEALELIYDGKRPDN